MGLLVHCYSTPLCRPEKTWAGEPSGQLRPLLLGSVILQAGGVALQAPQHCQQAVQGQSLDLPPSRPGRKTLTSVHLRGGNLTDPKWRLSRSARPTVAGALLAAGISNRAGQHTVSPFVNFAVYPGVSLPAPNCSTCCRKKVYSIGKFPQSLLLLCTATSADRNRPPDVSPALN